jgi:hypothetical protein
MNPDDPTLQRFLGPQLRDHAGRAEIAPGRWLIFAAEAGDMAGNQHALELLMASGLPHEVDASEDDGWLLYHVDDAARPGALHWLDDLDHRLAGRVRPVAPAHRALLDELPGSAMPHRVAQQLAALHAEGSLRPGAIDDPALVRSLLDRLHQREPLFFAAFHTLLAAHLVDMVALFAQLISEDVQLKNEIVTAGLSRDPFLQSRQDAAAGIRDLLLRFHVINALDQQKAPVGTNPYAAFLELVTEGSNVHATVDGHVVEVTRADFLDAVRSIRRGLYGGGQLAGFDTRVPWMNDRIARPFRFIKQLLAARPELAPLDGLHMLERAV